MFDIYNQGFPQHFAVKAAALTTHACRLDYVVKRSQGPPPGPSANLTLPPWLTHFLQETLTMF